MSGGRGLDGGSGLLWKKEKKKYIYKTRIMILKYIFLKIITAPKDNEDMQFYLSKDWLSWNSWSLREWLYSLNKNIYLLVETYK